MKPLLALGLALTAAFIMMVRRLRRIPDRPTMQTTEKTSELRKAMIGLGWLLAGGLLATLAGIASAWVGHSWPIWLAGGILFLVVVWVATSKSTNISGDY